MFYASCAIGAISAICCFVYFDDKLNLISDQTAEVPCVNGFINSFINFNKNYDSNFCTRLRDELKKTYNLSKVSVENAKDDTYNKIVVKYTTRRGSNITYFHNFNN